MDNIFSLNGIWNYTMGLDKEKEITIPGCWETLEENKTFDGPVWMRKVFRYDTVNSDNPRMRSFLCFEGVSYFCEVFLNGVCIGNHEGQWDEFRLDATKALTGGNNELILKIYKQGYDADSRFHYRESLSGFIPDVACTFGGIWRDVYIAQAGEASITNLFVKADGETGQADIELTVEDTGIKEEEVTAEIEIYDLDGVCKYTEASIYHRDNKISFNACLEDYIPWDTANPYLYELKVRLLAGGMISDTRILKFGFRNIVSEGNMIRLNGREIYVRGILHWGYHPEIAPNPSKEEIQKEIKDIKEMGFNLIKFCLYIPSKVFLEAADEMGMLAWVEFPLWLPRPSVKLFERIGNQYERILHQIKNHPSIIIYSLGCELNSDIGADMLRDLYRLIKTNAGSSLVRDNSGSGECYDGLAVDFADFYDYHFYCDLNFIEPMMDAYTPGWREKRPWMYGEFCDFDTFRSPVDIIERGGGNKPWWMENDRIKNPLLYVHNCYPIMSMGGEVMSDYLKNRSKSLELLSKKKAMVHRKYTMETVRSYPETSGYVVTSIRDCPLATSGMYDDFSNMKFLPEEFRRFNNDMILTLRWDIKTKWKNGGNRVFYADRYNYFSGAVIRAHMILSDFSLKPVSNGKVSWKFVWENGAVISSGEGEAIKSIAQAGVSEISAVELTAPCVDSARKMLLHCEFENGQTKVSNEWPFWIYPAVSVNPSFQIGLFDPDNRLDDKDWATVFSVTTNKPFQDSDVVVATRFDSSLEEYLKNGGRVIYVQGARGKFNMKQAPFWRECIQEFVPHPLTEALNNEGFADLQWMGMASDVSFIPEQFIESLPDKTKYTPVIRRIDCRNYEISDYLIEAELGKGRMIATSLSLCGGMGIEPSGFAANTGAVFLMGKIIDYLLK